MHRFWSGLSLAATACLTVATGTQAADLQKLTVVLGYVADVESYGAIFAKEKGFFEAEGLDVTVVPATMGVDQVQMVASGTADIGIVGPELILAGTDKGEKFKVIAGQFQRTPVAMTCRKDSGVTQPTQLPGKRLGLKPTASAYADLFLKKNGVDKSAVTITAIGPNDISLLVSNTIDCMMTTFAFNEPRQIEDLGVPVNVISLGDYGLNGQMNAYFVNQKLYDTAGAKDLLAKYMRAEMKAWDAYFKDPAAAAKFIIDGGFADGLDLNQQIYQAEQQVAYMTSLLTKDNGLMWLDPKIWKETAGNAKDAGLTTTIIDTDAMVTNEILAAAQPTKR